MDNVTLKRSVSLTFLVFYGIGTMIGAGFYALLGKVAGEAGSAAPMAFVTAGILALIVAFVFAELSSRYPYSAGEAHYVGAAFGSRVFSALIGYSVMLTGIVSAATLVVAIEGFLQDFVSLPRWPTIVVVTAVLAAVAVWGINQSVAAVNIITVLTLAGLIYVFALTGDNLHKLDTQWHSLYVPTSASIWFGVFAAGFLAFYAFIGFEDMVNIAEEVKDERRALPRGILIAIVATITIYFVMASIAVLTVPPQALAESNTPLARLVEGRGWYSTEIIGLVSLVAAINSALVQLVMASRVGYGLARDNKLPALLGEVHPLTRTPIPATILVGVLILSLALFFPLTTLAQATSSIILVIFASVSAALFWIKINETQRPEGIASFPIGLSALGCILSVAALLFHLIYSA